MLEISRPRSKSSQNKNFLKRFIWKGSVFYFWFLLISGDDCLLNSKSFKNHLKPKTPCWFVAMIEFWFQTKLSFSCGKLGDISRVWWLFSKIEEVKIFFDESDVEIKPRWWKIFWQNSDARVRLGQTNLLRVVKNKHGE